MRFRHPITVTRIRGGYIGPDGRRVPVSREPLAGFAFAPGRSTENPAFRAEVTTKAELYGPPGVDIRAEDSIEVPGKGIWQVDGDPADWGPNPHSGHRPGSVILLKRQTG